MARVYKKATRAQVAAATGLVAPAGKPKPKAKVIATQAYVDRKLSAKIETKYVYDNNATYVTDTPLFEHMFDSLTRGDDVDDFQGNRISPSYLQVRGEILAATSDGRTAPTLQTSSVRLIFFQWKPDTSDDTPDITEILQSPASSTGDYAFGQYRGDSKKFKVLKDINTFTTASAGNPHTTRSFSFSIPAKKLSKMHFLTGALSGENLIYVMVYGSQPNAAATNAPLVRWMAKLSYKDA